MTGFTFDPSDTWDVSTGIILGQGNHIVEIMSADATSTSSGGHPEIQMQLANSQGEIRDWLVITPSSFRKVTSLILAAGVPEANYPQPGRDFDAETGRFKQEYVDKQLVGRKVGAIVRDEVNNLDPTKPPRARVKGYVTPETLANGSGPAVSTDVAPDFAPNVAAEDVPF